MLKPKQKLQLVGRRGAAVVELAVCLPAIVLLVMGALECCTMVFLRQSLHVAAYEGVRVAIRKNTDAEEVLARCQRIIDEREIENAQVVLTPEITQQVPRGMPISVQVSAPCETNNALPLRFFAGNTLSAQATMIKE